MTGSRWRCFVAVPIGEDLRADLLATAEAWRGSEDLRWTDPDTWHVTLAFLGGIRAASIPGLVERLEMVADSHPPATFATGGLGAFPTPARARVAWYGVEDDHRRLAQVAADLWRALELDAPQAFRPHVTLARARRQPVDLRSWLASASVPGGVLDVDRIALMRSHVCKGPAHYETLATIRLGVPAHA